MSTAPSPYQRQANFTSFEQSSPTLPKRGTDLDAEFNAVRTLANALLTRLSEIQRDDGRLANGVVRPDALSTDTLTLIGSDITPRGDWATDTVYDVRDLVAVGGISYVAITEHLSGVFAADLAAGKWQGLTASQDAADIPFTPTGGLLSTDVQAALAEVAAALGGKQASNANLAALAGLTLGINDIVYATGPGALAVTTLTPVGRQLIQASSALTMRTVLELVKGVDPGNVVVLDGSARLPAVNGSLLTNVTPGNGTVGEAQLAATLNLAAKTVTLRAADKAVDYIEIRDEKAAGTDGGGFTQGAWQTRTLNTEHADAGGHATVAANQITLLAGTYLCDIDAPAGVVNSHQARLQNITDGTTTLVGTSEYTGSGNTTYTRSRITGRFTIASTKVFEVQHQCQTTKATDGFGNSANFGVTEVYTVARFWKVG